MRLVYLALVGASTMSLTAAIPALEPPAQPATTTGSAVQKVRIVVATAAVHAEQ